MNQGRLIARFLSNRRVARHIQRLSGPSLTRRITILHAAIVRRSRGRIKRSFLFAGGQRVMSLTTTGRRSGRKRSTTVAYFRDGSSYITTAANLGNRRDPAWCLNLRANPVAEIEAAGERLVVHARQAEGEERRRLWREWNRRMPPADRVQELSGREIPVFRLDAQ